MKNRSFTVVDAAMGPIIYRFNARTRDDLEKQLGSISLRGHCARNVAKAAWGGCVVAFDQVALVVVPGDHAAVFTEYEGGEL